MFQSLSSLLLVFLYICSFTCAGVAGVQSNFLTPIATDSNIIGTDYSEPACEGSHIKTCQSVGVDLSKIENQENITITGIDLKFNNSIDPNGYHYISSDGDEAIFTIDKGKIYGSLKTVAGRNFALEEGISSYTWEEFDVDSFPEELDLDDDSSLYVMPVEHDNELSDVLEDRHVVKDEGAIATYSVMVYYTKDFKRSTKNIELFVKQVLAETNQIYANSKVPIRVKLHCLEEATINDSDYRNLHTFGNMKGWRNTEKLRNSADAAVLLVRDHKYCGAAWRNTVKNGRTVSMVKKSCALGYYSFGREIGHNFGLHHMVIRHLIAPSNDGKVKGARTTLAYSPPGHRDRVNYYSNPNLLYPQTKTSLGVHGQSNNTAVLMKNRFAMARIGDESNQCSGGNDFTKIDEII